MALDIEGWEVEEKQREEAEGESRMDNTALLGRDKKERSGEGRGRTLRMASHLQM